MMKARRRTAHGWLKAWAIDRERITQGNACTLAKVRELGDGAGLVTGGDPSALTPMERQCERLERCLRIERYMRVIPREWYEVLIRYYFEQKPYVRIAVELRIDRNRVAGRVEDAQDYLMREFEAEDIRRLADSRACLTAAAKSVQLPHRGVVRPREIQSPA